MNRKIWKALGIAVCMLALAAPRAMAETHSHMVSNDGILKQAIKAINNSSDDNANEIILTSGFTLEGDTTEYTLRRGTTTIKGEGNTITVNPGAGIKVTGEKTTLNLGANGYDGTLTIDGKTSGGSASGNAKNAFVSVLEGATANMYENVTLQNGEFADKACVVIKGSDSAFNMYGGVIENCSRAVTAESEATFNMSMPGGEIRNCVSKNNEGGGVHVSNATFVMSGGTISRCKAQAYNGGGLYATNSSKITITDGTISGCEGVWGGGLYADNSTVTISGGTISGCKVGAGGGLFATNSSEITISGGTISECSTTLDTGKGGGLYAENSTITISGGTIKDNEAAHGGGVALTDSTVKKDEKPIRNWMVVGNKAYKTGGGIWLGEKVEWDISDRTKQIYNNQAIEQGADIFLEGGTSAIKLPNAANMGAKYHDSGINIDNWYNDNPRYTPSENGQVVKANKWLNGGLSLVASYKADPVRIEIDANGGVGGSISQTVQKGTTVTLEAPTREGYLFKGWKDEKGNSYPAGEDGKVKITVTGDMTLTAEWKKLPSAENLPKTGDESPVLLWGAALAVSAAACFMLRRKK